MTNKPTPVIMPKQGELLPSQREATIAMTARYGPKKANHITPVELSRQAGKSGAATPRSRTTPRSAPDATATTTSPTKAPVKEAAVAAKKAPVAPVPDVAKAAAPVATAAVATASTSASEPFLARERALSSWTTTEGLLSNRVVLAALAVGAAALTVVSIYKGVEMYNRHRLGLCIAEVEREQPDVVHLYIHRRSPLSPSVSVPCTQVETFLRIAGIPYVAHVISDTSVSPNGQLPFIVYGEARVAGARPILEALTSQCGVTMDARLTREEQATGVALESVLAYSFGRAYTRSVHVDKPDAITPYYSEMNHTPDWLTKMALGRMRTQAQHVNDASGYSRLSKEQYQHVMEKDVIAIEELLAHHDFLFSSAHPCSYDCALYAWLLPIVAMENAVDVNCAFERIVQSEPLTSFVKRMTEIAFPDLDELVATSTVYDEVVSISDDEEKGSEQQEEVVQQEAASHEEGPHARAYVGEKTYVATYETSREVVDSVLSY